MRKAKQREKEKKQPRNIKTSGKQRNDFTDTTYKHTFPFGVVSFLFMHATPTERDSIPLEEIPLPNSFATVLPPAHPQEDEKKQTNRIYENFARKSEKGKKKILST